MKNRWVLVLCALMFSVMLILFSSCSDGDIDEESIDSSEFQNLYQAYGLEEGDEDIGDALYENPPKAIKFNVFNLQAFKPGGIPLEIGEISLNRGEAANISLDETVLLSQDHNGTRTGFLNAEIEILFDPPKNGEGPMFVVNNKGGHKIVHEHEAYSEPQVMEGSYEGETLYQIMLYDDEGIPLEPYLLFFLGEKGQMGNSGVVLCRITGVKR